MNSSEPFGKSIIIFLRSSVGPLVLIYSLFCCKIYSPQPPPKNEPFSCVSVLCKSSLNAKISASVAVLSKGCLIFLFHFNIVSIYIVLPYGEWITGLGGKIVSSSGIKVPSNTPVSSP